VTFPAARAGRTLRATLTAAAHRTGARSRLTLIYAGLFLVTGVLLLTVNDGLTHQQLNAWQQQKAALSRQLSSHTASTATGAAVPGRQVTEPAPAAGSAPVPGIGAVPVRTGADSASVSMQLARQSALQEAERAVLSDSVIALGLMTAVAGLIGWLMAGRVLRPVHLVSATARRLSERDLHQRIATPGPRDEMRELAETFNDMLARLERAFGAQRTFVANASHELRTPIAMHRALAEVALRQPGTDAELRTLATDVLEVAEQEERIVSGLLALARSQHGIETYHEVNLAVVAARTVDGAAAEDCGHHITADRQLDPAIVTGSPVLIDLLVTNLVRNAYRHNIDGGSIHLRTGGTCLVVDNTGPVLTSEDIARLSEPFRRGTGDRTGTAGAGLGLPIILAVADAHHATMRLTAREGGGLRAEVTFPQQRS
jgi:signal transduction histidine kinase